MPLESLQNNVGKEARLENKFEVMIRIYSKTNFENLKVHSIMKNKVKDLCDRMVKGVFMWALKIKIAYFRGSILDVGGRGPRIFDV